jgi:hypothetical protein
MLLASAMSCRRNSSRNPVSDLLKELEDAAEARDVKPFEKRMASGFSGNEGIHREEALALLRRYFIAYEEINLDVTNVEPSPSGNHVTFHVAFSGRAKAEFNLQNLLPSSASYDFELELMQEEGTLKVNKAFWREVSPFQGQPE